MKRSCLRELIEARAGRRSLTLITALAGDRQWIEYEEALPGFEPSDPKASTSDLAEDPSDVLGSLSAPMPLRRAAREALLRGKSERFEYEGEAFFLEVMHPPLRLFVIGAVHIAQSLVPMAALLGYEVVLIDPRRAFATAERFSGVDLRIDWPDEALSVAEIDSRSAVITLSHDPKIDDPALRIALASRAFYIGSLGSARTHAKRIERLSAQGFTPDDLARIHAPIGLAIGARGAGEIAAAIVSELVATHRSAKDPISRKHRS
ncbi:XdhC family protein [Thioalkalivibrio sp. HK1]|uniref:XdhC family protein n=1 Tax=Thioalkalivibrio sp. HK1 TaxID=1469245 RepID=UPI000470DDBF|nr:XdhC family protein [Thioalkalivibrio sp. HK1]